jgi:hypothetical protein
VPAPCRRSVALTAKRITEVDVAEKYLDVFNGRLGLLEEDVHLEVDPIVMPPVQMPLRRQPVTVRYRVEAEIQKPVAENVIAPVTKPTPRVSSLLVITRRDNSLRICTDPKFLNLALLRSTHCMPTIDDVLPKLSKAKIFSTSVTKSVFWHSKLDEPPSYLTTFEYHLADTTG